jgi:FkbM family methyltransferase
MPPGCGRFGNGVCSGLQWSGGLLNPVRVIHLRRLPLVQRFHVLAYYVRRWLLRGASERESWLLDYFNHLVEADGFLERLEPLAMRTTYRHPEYGRFRVLVRHRPSSDMRVLGATFGRPGHFDPLFDVIRESGAEHTIRRVLDGGAYVGYTAVLFSRAFPEAEILCVEPVSESFRLLLRVIEMNDLRRVTPLRAGLWSRDGFLEVVPDDRAGVEWGRRVRESAGETDLPARTLQRVLRDAGWERVDLLKLDIEGAEGELTKDRDAFGDVLARVRFLAMEIHDSLVSREAMLGRLADAGFRTFDAGELTIGVNRAIASAGSRSPRGP